MGLLRELLSESEYEVLRAAADFLPNEEIPKALEGSGLRSATTKKNVENTFHGIYIKLPEVSMRQHTLPEYLQHSLVGLPLDGIAELTPPAKRALAIHLFRVLEAGLSAPPIPYGVRESMEPSAELTAEGSWITCLRKHLRVEAGDSFATSYTNSAALTRGTFFEEYRYEFNVLKNPAKCRVYDELKMYPDSQRPQVADLTVTFSPPLVAPNYFSFELVQYYKGAYALTLEEADKLKAQRADFPHESVEHHRYQIRGRYDKLRWQITFPKGYKLMNPRVEVRYYRSPNHDETRRAREKFRDGSDPQPRLALEVDNPLPLHDYFIIWVPPSTFP